MASAVLNRNLAWNRKKLDEIGKYTLSQLENTIHI